MIPQVNWRPTGRGRWIAPIGDGEHLLIKEVPGTEHGPYHAVVHVKDGVESHIRTEGSLADAQQYGRVWVGDA